MSFGGEGRGSWNGLFKAVFKNLYRRELHKKPVGAVVIRRERLRLLIHHRRQDKEALERVIPLKGRHFPL